MRTYTISRHRYSAFTLLELLVSIAVIAILAAIIISAMGKVSSRARSVKCQNNLRQIALATLTYSNESGGSLAPMMSQDWASYGGEKYPDAPLNRYLDLHSGVFLCDGDIEWQTGIYDYQKTSYAVNQALYFNGDAGFIVGEGPKLINIEYPSRTILYGETLMYQDPRGFTWNTTSWHGDHGSHLVNVVMVDASVATFVPESSPRSGVFSDGWADADRRYRWK